MNRENIEKAINLLQAMLDADDRAKESEQKLNEVEIIKNAYEHSLDAVFDGIKYIANPDKPFEIVLPMKVYANQYYNYNGTRYVCIKECVFDGTNIDECLTEF